MYLATALAKILEDDKSIKCIASFNDIMSPTYIIHVIFNNITFLNFDFIV